MRSLSFALLVPVLAWAEEASPCHSRGTSLVVRSAEHRLYQCEAGREVKSFLVSLGKGGTDKRRRGDNKTPLGSYPLGDPRPSKKFGTFIALGYPTAEQSRKGYTGGDIGIHGPARGFGWAGRLNVSVDWTQGCIALASDTEILQLASWVRRKQPKLVHIE